MFSSEFKYASYYICTVSILDGSVIVVSLISFFDKRYLKSAPTCV